MGKIMKYKFLKHTADVKFRAYGSTISKSFENAAVAMFKAMYPGSVKNLKTKKIKVKGKDLESLLYNFLEELIVLLDSKDFFLSKAKVKISEKDLTLTAELFGDNAKNYLANLEVKAITYNEMFVRKIKGQWVCQVVLDV